MMLKEKLTKAKNLIKAKQYDKARILLQEIDHPIATQWLNKLNTLTQQRVQESKHNGKSSKGHLLIQSGIHPGAAIYRLFFGAVGFIFIFVAFAASEKESFTDKLTEPITLFLSVFGVSCIIMFAVPVIKAIIQRRRTFVYENGIERKTRSKSTFIPWQEMEKIEDKVSISHTGYFITMKYGSCDIYVKNKVAIRLTPIDTKWETIYRYTYDQLANLHRFKRSQQFSETPVYSR